jgi:hypothetical protein
MCVPFLATVQDVAELFTLKAQLWGERAKWDRLTGAIAKVSMLASTLKMSTIDKVIDDFEGQIRRWEERTASADAFDLQGITAHEAALVQSFRAELSAWRRGFRHCDKLLGSAFTAKHRVMLVTQLGKVRAGLEQRPGGLERMFWSGQVPEGHEGTVVIDTGLCDDEVCSRFCTQLCHGAPSVRPVDG